MNTEFRIIFHAAICCVFALFVAAQHNSLNGKISFINSGKTPAVGVEISGKSEALGKANAVYSDSGGFYCLVFPKPGAGHLVELSVGDTDTDGQAIEVVNDAALRICRIPEDPSEPFEIIVCKKGERDLVAQKYYRVIKSSADKALAAKKAEWVQLVEQEKKDYKAISTLLEELDRLEKQADSISIYREAYRIASINKDNATKRVLNYLDLLEKGKSVQEARKVLNMEKATEELEKSGSQFNAAIEELETRAGASKSIFEYKDAIKCYDTIIYYSERIKVDRLVMAGYYTEIAKVFSDIGNYATALKYDQKSLDIREQNLEPKHPDVAIAYNNIGNTHQALGQYETALKYLLKAIGIWQEPLDSDPFNLVISYNNIAWIYRALGEYETALEYQQKAISIFEETSFSQPYHSAGFYNNIAIIYHALGKYKTALEYHQKAMLIQEEILDPKHPDMAVSYGNIGTVYRALGEYKTALEYYQKAMRIREEILEPKHPALAVSYSNIGIVYRALGEYKTALEYHQKAMRIREESLHSKHPDLASSYNHLGNIYTALGKYKIALEYYQKAMHIREEILEPKHPDLASSYNYLGNIYKALGKYKIALEYYQKAVYIQEESLGPKHLDLAVSYNHLGNIYTALGKYKIALNYYQKAMAIQEESLDLKHPDLGITYDNIGIIHLYLGQYKIALDYQQKVIHIWEENLDPYHLAIAYNNISVTYRDLGKYEIALNYQRKVIGIWKTINPEHPNLGSSYWNTALIYSDMKDFQKAISFQEKCLAVFKAALPENHPDWKKALGDLAQIYYEAGNYSQAVETYQNLIKTFPEVKKEDFYSDIGLAYAKNRQLKEAYNAFKKHEKLFPKEAKTYRNWAVYYALQNDTEKALYNLQKAVELGYNNLEWLQTDNSIDGLRNENAFIEIIKKLEKAEKK